MKLKTMALVVSFVGLPLAALASQHETRPGQAAQPGQQPPAAQAEREAGGLVASDAVRGATVRDQAGQRVGTVDRLVADRQSGQIQRVVVASGGLLGIGRDHVQLPWNEVQLARDNGNIIAQVDRQRLDQAQPIDPRQLDRDGTQGNLVTASQLEGSRVLDAQGRDLGSIERLMINPADGRVRYAVIGTGGFLGVGRDQALVPWDNMQVGWDANRMVVTLDQRFLQEAPRTWMGAEPPPPAASPRAPQVPQPQQTPPSR
jgi:sporulation protein YlmC with PRC-barrel domain